MSFVNRGVSGILVAASLLASAETAGTSTPPAIALGLAGGADVFRLPTPTVADLPLRLGATQREPAPSPELRLGLLAVKPAAAAAMPAPAPLLVGLRVNSPDHAAPLLAVPAAVLLRHDITEEETGTLGWLPQIADVEVKEKRSRPAHGFRGILANGPSAARGGTTLAEALSATEANNQQLAAAGAQFRATRELLPQARATRLPVINGVGEIGGSHLFGDIDEGDAAWTNSADFGVELNHPLFDGFKGRSAVSRAESQILAARSTLTNLEQTVLLQAVTAYMSVLHDRRIADLQRANLAFVDEQLRAASGRFEIGEATVTDVAQAEAQRSLAQALLNTAEAEVTASEATYAEVIGIMPGDLAPAYVPSKLLPRSVEEAQVVAQREHPSILAASYVAKAAASQVQFAEGGLLPSVNLNAGVRNESSLEGGYSGLPGVNPAYRNRTTASVGLKLTVPFYQGGAGVSKVREAKETLGQRRIEVDRSRSQVRTAVSSAWARLQAARTNITGFRAQVASAQVALEGVIEEQDIGQRTTLDILNAQSQLISAEMQLLGAERDLVVSSYNVFAALGKIPVN